MLKNKKIKIKTNRIIIPLISFILILVILFRFVEIKEFFNIITKIKWKWFFIALLFQFLSIFFSSLVRYELLENLKEKISLWFLNKISIAMVFIDVIIPSQGISSFIFLFKVLGKKGIEKGKRAILLINNFLLNYLVVFLLLLTATVYGIILKYNIIKTISFIILCLLLIIFLSIIIALLKIEKCGELIIKICKKPPIKFINKFVKNFEKRFSDLITSYYRERKKYKINYRRIILISFFENFCKILSLLFVIFSLNYNLTIDKIIIVYLLANLVALISYIKLGFFEAGLTIGLLGWGINYNLAFTTTIVFRIINFWIPLIFGYVFTRRILKELKMI